MCEVIDIDKELTYETSDFNSSQYEDLVGTLEKGTCLFMGAGVSKLAGYKTWDELRKEMVEYFWKEKDKRPFSEREKFDLSLCENLKKHGDIIEVFDYLYYKDKGLFVSGVKDIFKVDERSMSIKIYQLLKKLDNGKSFFVTTNIDKGLQKYLEIPDDRISISPRFTNPPKYINYLHGRIDFEETWILTRAQYNKGYYDEDAPCMNFIAHIFESYNVLFIGYGLREEEIMQAILKTGKRKLHYWLEPYSRNKRDFLEIRGTNLKENYNIVLIPYSIDKDDYEGLYKVINRLSMSITKKGSLNYE